MLQTLLHRLPRLLRQRHGVAALEFAIAAPVLILLLMAVIDFGRAIDQSIRLETAARAGAQYGLVYPDDTAGISARIGAALSGWSDWNAQIGLTCECASPGACTTGCEQLLTVGVTRPFTAAFFLRVTTLRGNVTIRVS
ncbi:TadE family protein [Roseicella aerolata]|uniref:Pilus assembly protein n=1 Tax=Roseicella aerolata TaxID=2883479 RepID=A0A9X1IHM2_9PROT|nr:TadE/TadG family type IV pilus assembly protein [Roseicella aerolata]MCB4824757.1 pilus assembly protein [Roseicella aerolata]